MYIRRPLLNRGHQAARDFFAIAVLQSSVLLFPIASQLSCQLVS